MLPQFAQDAALKMDDLIRTHPRRCGILMAVFVLVIVGLLIYMLHFKCKGISRFVNKSEEYGFNYETDTQRFDTADDKQIAVKALAKLVSTDIKTYTPDQIANMSDQLIIKFLTQKSKDRTANTLYGWKEEDEDDEWKVLMYGLDLFTDPDYKKSIRAVVEAGRNGGIFRKQEERNMIYNVIVRFFATLNTPITIPLVHWPDQLLIRTFQSRVLPSTHEFNRIY